MTEPSKPLNRNSPVNTRAVSHLDPLFRLITWIGWGKGIAKKLQIRVTKNVITRRKSFFQLLLWMSFVVLLIPKVGLAKTYSAGAYIIDMGQPTQTIANGLKPYGMVYELIKAGIPVDWAIEPSKAKDGIDFNAVTSANGNKAYKGGSFIIDAANISAANTIITKWKALSVVVDGPTTASFTAPVYKTLTIWPRAFLDAQNDPLITLYYNNAGVPINSYVLNSDPTMLPQCGSANGTQDVYILPHADPNDPKVWSPAYVTALQNFINNGGAMWAGCHAVSAMENIPGCNFLSNNGLVLWGAHGDGTPPYTYLNPADPIMQFIGILDAAITNGSERIYVPGASGWRASTKIAVYDPGYTNASITYPTNAGVIVYGPAFGTKGLVMYEAGHSLNGTNPEAVAAQRAFFNFLLLAGGQPQTNVSPPSLSNQTTTICSGNTFSITPSGAPANTTYTWTAPTGTGFSGGSAQAVPQTEITQTLDVTTASTAIAIYTITPRIGGCIGPTFTLTVTISPSPSLTSPLNPSNICSNTQFHYEPSSNATSTFPWTRAVVAGITNLGTSGTGIINEVLVNSTINPIAVNYLYNLFANGCTTINTVTVVVIPSPIVTASSNVNAICPGGSINLTSTSNTPSPRAPILLDENFNGTTNWTITHKDAASTSADWTLKPDGTVLDGKTFHSNDNSQFILSNSSAAKGETYLASPAMNTVGYKSLSLSFWHYFQDNGRSDESSIETSLDGASWSKLSPEVKYTATQGSSATFVHVTVNLSTYINKPIFYIRFKYKFDTDKYWAIDNIILSGESYYPSPTWTSIPVGFTSTAVNPTNIKPTQATEYTVTYKDPGTNCNGSASVSISIYSTLVPGAHNTDALTECAGYNPAELSFTTAITGGKSPYSYQWKLNNGNIGTNSPTYDSPPLTLAGSYSFNCVVTDGCGSTFTTSPKVITIVPDPSILISGNSTVCLNGNLTLTANITNGTGTLSYQWRSGTALSGTYTDIIGAASVAYNPPTSIPGTYYYQVFLNPSHGECNQTTSAGFTLTVNPKPTCYITGSDGPLATSSTGNIYLAPAGMSAYAWSIAGNYASISGVTSSTATITTGITNNAPFTLNLTITDANGCISTCSKTVTVNDKQPPTFTPPGPLSFCVENIFSAEYFTTGLKINPDPDYYLFKHGDTSLDLNPATFNDNCCALPNDQFTIRWEIVFSSGETTITGVGQPSAYVISGIPADFKLWGDGITFATRIHKIRYWLKDCNGNETVVPVEQTITIKPRPKFI